MSVSTYEGQVKRFRSEVADQQAKRAAADKKVADAESGALKLEQEARKTKSASLASSKLQRAGRKREEANKAREASAKASKALSDAQKKLFEAERKLAEAQAKARQTQETKERRAREREDRRRAAVERAREAELGALHSQHELMKTVLEAQPWANAPDEIVVLFIASSPVDEDRLFIEREVREIQHRLRLSEHRDSVRFAYRLAVRTTDLMQYLNEDRPHVVHFSGHGNQYGLAFEDADGLAKVLDNAQLSSLLSVTSDRIRLALFNSCESSAQAEAACDFIDAAIGMEVSIKDDTAKIFAAQFYNSLGFGRSLQQAFDQACVQVELETGALSGNPRLFVTPGIKPDEVFLVAPPKVS